MLMLATGCAVLDRGPDAIELSTEPAGAKVELRAPGRSRTLPGVTPMTIYLERTLPEPIEIVFHKAGYDSQRHRLSMQRRRGLEILPREKWRWPCDPIHYRLLPTLDNR